MWHVAQMNVGTVLYPTDDPRIAEFMNQPDIAQPLAATKTARHTRAVPRSYSAGCVRQHRSAAPQRKNFSADAGRRCTQNTQITVTE